MALLIVVAVSVITVTTIVTYMLTDIVRAVNGELIVDLDDYIANQDKTSFIYGYDKNGKVVELFKLHGRENRVWVSIDKMPQDLIDAFVALEDKRFKDHKGVDWYRTIAVVVEYKFKQGGSTITQQLIKNLTGEDGRTFSRKYKEIISALNLEKHYNKKTIIEAYLNTLYLDQGCYGVKTASQEYFGKDVSQLNAAECASLAAIT
ncbi:MAG TPA: biosynthetic peptidoglycan transglycosylase, partial [Clostridiales bacterium]|nr:biosynthetic peptidoglycan transglycosylase [Clostridiales bacterium]